MLPGMPKGGLLTVREIGAALTLPIFVRRSLKLRLVFSVTFPKLKGVLLVYRSQPPLGDSNSIRARGISEPEPRTLKRFEPPLELI